MNSSPAKRRRFPWRALALLWCVALFASWLWQRRAPVAPVPEGATRHELTLVGDYEGAPVPLDVWEQGPAQAPTVLCLHGSPGSHGDFRRMLPHLPGLHVFTCDLPGFGVDHRPLPDYSPGAHARYLAEWLERTDARDVHLLGYSMGGAVAIRLQALAPERIASITLLCSLGVEELELLGHPALNKALHGLLLGLVTAMDVCLPHFGYLQDFPINRA
ncbi:MAG: alpha/beta fold hydrolase, partial [Planctomycetes bacterium]|nr:alpha/beta fold hydrolase [Planctomycetota bacterium]